MARDFLPGGLLAYDAPGGGVGRCARPAVPFSWICELKLESDDTSGLIVHGARRVAHTHTHCARRHDML
eukprot:2408667-Prymnesium_polylepis.1